MKKLFVIICFVFSATFMFAQEFNKWSIEPEFGLTKLQDMPYGGSKVGLYNAGIGVRYMATPLYGVRVSGSYTNHNYTLTDQSVKYAEGQIFGVCNFGRLLKLERIAKNRYTIIGGIGGDLSNSHDFTNTQMFDRVTNFHLAGFVDNEFRVTDKFFLTAGLNVITGVNLSAPTGVTDINQATINGVAKTSIIDFNVKAIFVLGKKKDHADFYLEPELAPTNNIVYVDSTRKVTNNYYTEVCEEISAPTSNSNPEYVYFKNDSYKIDKDGLENIEQSLHKIKDKVTITAYCSNVASSEYNLKLAKNRANAVKDKLVNLGVDPSKINIVSIGIDFDRKIPELFDMARRVKIEF
ncbi:outer membrane porin F precursor [Aquipluma nitroreducens]|uniref:Outer membrane porin F n=1 Tax=Aquipluma nitroreducens TaxID=2010828 RepID=A0A5K7SDA5_9BACT|nr:OmpA family protein [Aquipluma nitroreducens]BBE19563.1 outer membrane porin F precursor [Aquipluma nitroreducens]